jgi:hypothetical protein
MFILLNTSYNDELELKLSASLMRPGTDETLTTGIALSLLPLESLYEPPSNECHATKSELFDTIIK